MEKAAGWIKRFVLVTTVYICADGGMKLWISPESTEKLGSFLFFPVMCGTANSRSSTCYSQLCIARRGLLARGLSVTDQGLLSAHMCSHDDCGRVCMDRER